MRLQLHVGDRVRVVRHQTLLGDDAGKIGTIVDTHPGQRYGHAVIWLLVRLDERVSAIYCLPCDVKAVESEATS
jgi:hypothetical protein